jgi:hypothetical protein
MHLLRLLLLASFLTALAGISQAQDAKNKKAAASGAAVVEGKTLGNGTFTGMVKDPPSDGRLMIRQIPAPPVAAVQPKVKGKSGAAQGNQKVDATQYAFTVDDKAKILFHVLPEAFAGQARPDPCGNGGASDAGQPEGDAGGGDGRSGPATFEANQDPGTQEEVIDFRCRGLNSRVNC